MDLGLKDKSALVLASSKGLGRAIATALAVEGARVMVSGRDEKTLAETAREIRDSTGAEVDYRVADLARAGDIEDLVGAAAERFGGIDVLMTNTGGPPAGGFTDFADADWTAAFELTLLSLIRAVRVALPHLRTSGTGRIVCVASSSIKQPIDNLTLSNTFRTGIAGLAKSLSAELAPDGILINTLGPGRIATDRTTSMDTARSEKLGVTVEEVRAEAEARIPLGRYGTPEEFAKIATFLASPANSYLTGQSLLVDGGMVRAL